MDSNTESPDRESSGDDTSPIVGWVSSVAAAVSGGSGPCNSGGCTPIRSPVNAGRWQPGDVCRARYSADSRIYEGVVAAVADTGRGELVLRVRFPDHPYITEQEYAADEVLEPLWAACRPQKASRRPATVRAAVTPLPPAARRAAAAAADSGRPSPCLLGGHTPAPPSREASPLVRMRREKHQHQQQQQQQRRESSLHHGTGHPRSGRSYTDERDAQMASEYAYTQRAGPRLDLDELLQGRRGKRAHRGVAATAEPAGDGDDGAAATDADHMSLMIRAAARRAHVDATVILGDMERAEAGSARARRQQAAVRSGKEELDGRVTRSTPAAPSPSQSPSPVAPLAQRLAAAGAAAEGHDEAGATILGRLTGMAPAPRLCHQDSPFGEDSFDAGFEEDTLAQLQMQRDAKLKLEKKIVAVVPNNPFDQEDNSNVTRPSLLTNPPFPREPFVLKGGDGDQCCVVNAYINQYLREYQREGIQFLFDAYMEGRGALLADDMGLGKTVQVIGLLAAVFGKTGLGAQDNPHEFIRKKERMTIPGVVLIVCPTVVLYNWQRELLTWVHFRVGICHGPNRDAVLEATSRQRYDVVITTYGTVVAYAGRMGPLLMSSCREVASVPLSCKMFPSLAKWSSLLQSGPSLAKCSSLLQMVLPLASGPPSCKWSCLLQVFLLLASVPLSCKGYSLLQVFLLLASVLTLVVTPRHISHLTFTNCLCVFRLLSLRRGCISVHASRPTT